jgi:hypothetical protein
MRLRVWVNTTLGLPEYDFGFAMIGYCQSECGADDMFYVGEVLASQLEGFVERRLSSDTTAVRSFPVDPIVTSEESSHASPLADHRVP